MLVIIDYMGTNYYARIIPSKKRKDYLKKLINEDKFIEIDNELESMYGRYSDDKTSEASEIHLGKRSAGWKFLFNPNYEKYYPLTREGLMNFLKREDVVIYSEYFNGDNHVYGYTDDPDEPHDNNEYLWTPEQFMNMALNWGKEDGWSGREYEEYEYEKTGKKGSYTKYGDERELFWKEKGYNPEYYNFFNDGMRWSTCCDFS